MSETVEYHNPVVTGFNPDPSVVYVDGVFYMATSTFHVFPGIPIHASTNLREWKLIGHAINRPEQLSLFYAHSRLIHLENGNGMIATGGLQAPTIRYHKGKFYVVGSNLVRREGVMSREQFVVSTEDIWQSKWSDPATFDFHGFDTSIFIDDDERVYVQGAWATGQKQQPHTLIYQLELELETGRALSPARCIWDGHFKYDTEGPHIYKRDGWYYLIAAEGGTFEHHMLSISRSRDIWGPYESYENNPILTADGRNTPIQGLGHGELFEDGDGEWWVVALGFRCQDGVWPLGREPFLSKVEWPVGGWPIIEQPEMCFQASRVRETAIMPNHEPVCELVHLRGRDDSNYRHSLVGETELIQLRPSQFKLRCLRGSPTFIGRRQKQLEGVARVTLDTRDQPPTQEHVVAGLTIYLDPVRHVTIAYDFATSTVVFKMLVPEPGTSREISYAIDREHTCAIDLMVEATSTAYAFSFARVGDLKDTARSWQEAGSATTRELFVRFFTGPIFGIFTEAEWLTDQSSQSWVTFRNFQASSYEATAAAKPRI
ncbi:glycosyl hydrolases family 43 domain-containing protein [Sarocladium implicatum]|nr:glycosyl hydrolases family 43 domain-containing protein [Sarocladium implicatum]